MLGSSSMSLWLCIKRLFHQGAIRNMRHSLLFGLSILILLLWSSMPLNAVEKPEVKMTVSAFDPIWRDKVLDIGRVDAVSKGLSTVLKSIPTDTASSSLDGRKKVILKKRIELLATLKETILRYREIDQGVDRNLASEESLDKKIQSLEKTPKPIPPSSPNLEGFTTLQEKYDTRLKEVDRLLQENSRRREMLQRIPDMILSEKKIEKEAEEELSKLERLRSNSDESEKQMLDLRSNNAELLRRLTEERIALWGKEEEYEKNHGVRLDKELELAQQYLKRDEEELKLYQEALDKSQGQTLQTKTSELEKKEEQAQQAGTDLERFFAHWDIRIARIQKNIADWHQLRTNIAKEIGEQERKFAKEKPELDNLKALVKRVGSQGVAAELLKSTFKVIGQRRKDLDHGLSVDFKNRFSVAQNRHVEVESALSDLHERWSQEMDQALIQVPEAKKRASLESRARQLRNIVKDGLRNEKRALFEINVERRRLELLFLERVNVLNDLERFVLSKVFWIQDADPVGLNLARSIIDEIFSSERQNSVIRWLERLFSKQSVWSVTKAVSNQRVILNGVGIVFALIVIALATRAWLKKSIDALREASVERRRIKAWVTPLAAAFADAGLWPLNLLIGAWALGAAGLPEGVGDVLSRLLMHWALFLFLWRFNQRFFSSEGISGALFGMPEDLSRSLRHAFLIVLIAYPVLFTPWIIFRGAPFNFEALPRLSYTMYEITVAFIVFLLIRPTSPLIQHAFGVSKKFGNRKERSFISKHWGLFSGLIFLYLTAVVFLDVLGYRFGAAYLTRNGLLTLITLFLLIGAHHLSSKFVMRLVPSQAMDSSAPPGENSQESRITIKLRLRKIVRLFFIILGAWILFSYWGINEQTFNALNGYAVFSASQADGRTEIVSAADMLRFMMTVVLTIWLMRNLSGIYELTLFRILRMDQGLRYAIFTISRYLIALIGLPLALSWLHVDLGKIAWLAAAISVGIGFGLQEIVANFISGIILLVERPIRVGDRITVGVTRGEVQRINIRATTVINRDQQEIIIPNRDLITKEVVNWTLSHNHVRLKIPIGVAYGSDVERVRALLLDVAKQDPDVLNNPPSRAFFMLHGSSSLDFELRVFYQNPDNLGRLTDRLTTAINKTFVEHSIEIPFPQQDIHIRSGVTF